jgi:predicted secreted protein
MPLHLNAKDDGSQVAIEANDSVVLSLPEYMDGYRWAPDSPLTILALLEDTYQAQSTAIGGETIRRFTYRAVRPGAEVLRLKLWRDWSGEIAKRFETTVAVR